MWRSRDAIDPVSTGHGKAGHYRNAMLIPFHDNLMVTNRADQECRCLADRHYSRQSHGHREFVGPGRNLILRDAAGTVLFVWLWPYDGMRMDGQTGFNCTMFRNESTRRSSDIILEAEGMAIEKWGPNRMYTYVDARKIESRNPGYCFKKAGWRFVKLSAGGKHLLEKAAKEEG